MVNYCQPADVISYIGGATPPRLDNDNENDFSGAALNARIKPQAAKLQAIFGKFIDGFGYTLPTAPTQGTPTNRWALLELLNVELIAAQLIRERAGLIDPLYSRQANTQIRFALERFNFAFRGRLNLAFEMTLPTDPLCNVADAIIDLPGFIPSGFSKPSLPVIERLILRESAFARALIAFWGFDQYPDDPTTIEILRDLVSRPVRAYVLRINSSDTGGGILDATVNALLSESIAAYGSIDSGERRMSA